MAEIYDDKPAHAGNDPGEPVVGDVDATVTFLEGLAHGGPALELAVGTGRIALPLSARGITVDGIDFSEAMVAKLRAKPGGDRLSVTMGNYADVGVPGTYRLVYIVANSLSNLLTQDEQVRCFENVVAHLTEDGSFVLEARALIHLGRSRAGVSGGFGVRPDLDVGGFDPEAGHDGGDLLPVGVAVVQRLRDEHGLFGLVRPLIQDDQLPRVRRLRQEPLPNQGVLVGTPLELVEVVGVLFVVDPLGTVATPR
jgi:hypothetical protein